MNVDECWVNTSVFCHVCVMSFESTGRYIHLFIPCLHSTNKSNMGKLITYAIIGNIKQN